MAKGRENQVIKVRRENQVAKDRVRSLSDDDGCEELTGFSRKQSG